MGKTTSPTRRETNHKPRSQRRKKKSTEKRSRSSRRRKRSFERPNSSSRENSSSDGRNRQRGGSRSRLDSSSCERQSNHRYGRRSRYRLKHRRYRPRNSRSRSRRSWSRASSRGVTPKRKHVDNYNDKCVDQVSRSNDNNNTSNLLTELLKSLVSCRSEGNKFPMLGNVIPEFDPMVKGQTVHIWLNKVDECARLYKWGDDQVIHYALPKLSGVAKTWYQALPTMSFSWQEWQIKLTESFPSSDDYAELLTAMLSKRVKYNESLELYYYEKINLLNRCEIGGKRAVDCLLYGIEDRSLRLGAKASKCQEPEQVLEYFQSIKQQSRDLDKTKFSNNDDTVVEN